MQMDFETVLKKGTLELVTSDLGASLRDFSPWLWGYRGAKNKRAGQGDVLMPFPSRIKNGVYSFQGKHHILEKNDKEGPNAIHGFYRTKRWKILSQNPDAITYGLTTQELTDQGYPFALELKVTYQLVESGFICSFEAKNIGKTAAPFAAGFHPYFKLEGESCNDWRLQLPSSQYLEFEKTLVPTGRTLRAETHNPEMDFRQIKAIGAVKLNSCFLNLDRDSKGISKATLQSQLSTLDVWMDSAFNYLVVYSGDAIDTGEARKSIAIEPMTCATDAFNHPEWGLKVLSQGETWGGRFGVNVKSN